MYPCIICDRLFSSDTSLKQHQQDSPMHAKTFYCKGCDRTFGSEQALDQHRRDAPAHTKNFNCKTCNRSLRSASALDQHQRDSPNHKHPSKAPVTAGLRYPPSQTSELPDPGVEHPSRRDSQISPARPTRKKPPTRNVETREFLTFPELHQSIAEAIAPHATSSWFYKINHNDRYYREHSTNVMGRFMCNHKGCKQKSWGSKIVAVWIREYAGNGYSALVYNQRCRSCDHLGELTMDKDCYIDRIAYRLKKWAGVMMEEPPYELKKGPPHESELCEGCKKGVCPQSKSLHYTR